VSESTLLVIDDEAGVRFGLKKTLTSLNLSVETAETARLGIDALQKCLPDVVLLDIRLPDMSGLDALSAIRKIDQRLPVVIITAHGTTDIAIEATKRGAFDYLLKPFDLPTLRSVVSRALEASRLTRRPALVPTAENGEATGDPIVGRSAVMQDVFKAIGRVAASDINVLLLGESGVGKELVARAIFQHSRRSGGPFLAINCAAIPETLLESELFGHEKGSFTGAERQRVGRFEQASGGTIFLDEIGDMSPAIQAKVLRLLQDQRFERVGGSETIQADVRVIAATNQNLPELVAAGRFRQDLFYRLNTYTILIPPLRSRRDDLPLLIDYFIKSFCPVVGKYVSLAAPETLKLLDGYPWPGNVRELQGVIKTALVNATSDVLTPECLPESITHPMSADSLGAASDDGSLDLMGYVRRMIANKDSHLYRKMQFAVDRAVFREVLDAVGGNQVEAARMLGISRTTLRAKLQTMHDMDRATQEPVSEQSVQ
jgi:two-component system nitrogen regulation response regulator GlnG